MPSEAIETPLIIVSVLAAPLVCLFLFGLSVAWQRQQVYKRIGDYSIGSATFHGQLEHQGLNFPGPNVLGAKIAAQPGDVQTYIQVVRRRIRHLRWAVLSYIGFLLILGLTVSLVRKLSS